LENSVQDPEERFGFGKNWEEFIQKHFNDERVRIAGEHLLAFLNLPSLKECHFLDVGCGSGLNSLAALRAGAGRIVSFDYDPRSVSTTEGLKQFAGNPAHWEVRQGSILDNSFLQELEPADIVYSWGVLHHTGAMWVALNNCLKLMKDGGVFYAALYDHDIHVNPTPEFWLEVKQRYNQSTSLGKKRMVLWYIWQFVLAKKLRNVPELFRRIREYKRSRGMDFFTDVRDWLGGWPMEFAKRQDVRNWAEEHGLDIINLKTGEANSEYLFRKKK